MRSWLHHIRRVPRSIWVILAIALLLRLGWALTRPAPSFASLPDQREYVELARNVLDGRGFVFRDDRLNADVYAFRTPGYPLFLAACGANVRIARVAQCFIDTSTVLAVFLLARRWVPVRTSLIAASIVAINPYLVSFSALMLSETLFIALLTWGIAAVAHRRITIGSLLLAISVLVRPSAVLLPTILAFASTRTWRAVAIGFAMTIVVLLPWAIRNHQKLGAWVFLTSNGGFTMYDGFNPAATGASNQSFVVGELHDELVRQPNEIERSHVLSNRAMQFIRENRARVASLTLAKIARTWSPIPLSSEYGSDRNIVVIAAAYTIPLFLLVVAGLWIAPLPRAAKVMLMLPAVYFTAVHALSVGSLRYRIPADVTMSVIAAAAMSSLFVRKPADRSQSEMSDQ